MNNELPSFHWTVAHPRTAQVAAQATAQAGAYKLKKIHANRQETQQWYATRKPRNYNNDGQ